MDKTLEIELTEIRPKVLATALKFSRASRLDGDPEDVVQDVLLRLWVARRDGVQIRSAEAWAVSTTKNSCISLWRKKGPVRSGVYPEWRWYASVSKNIGAFNLSVKVYDILNQTRRLTHTVTANYEEDSYRRCMRRYILLGVKWNFGKMNAVHSARAQQAAWNMLF
jgi:DNA-directed RNA polymerase specialized sigma24 family protein